MLRVEIIRECENFERKINDFLSNVEEKDIVEIRHNVIKDVETVMIIYRF
ncbi:MAG: hypothetical protein ACRDD7_16340 [Peptostreptococcaceae bacterium]